jgi:hypothetical protein
MPILGIIASSFRSAGGGPEGAYDALATVTVPSGGVASVTFAGIPTGYKHLQIRILGRTTATGNRTHTFLQFNGDTTSNYRWHGLAASPTGVSGEEAGSLVSAIRLGSSNLPMGDASANMFGVSIADILDYANVNKNKVTRAIAGQDQNNANSRISFVSGLWLNTAAITSIKVYPDGANWAEFSSIALYGVR